MLSQVCLVWFVGLGFLDQVRVIRLAGSSFLGFQCQNGWVGFAWSDMLGQFCCIRFAGRFLQDGFCWVG